MIILKIQLNHQLDIVILKEFGMLQNVLWIVFFFFTISSQGNFLYCPRFFTLTKILILSAFLLKWNKTCYIEFFLIKIFISFVKLLNSSLGEYSLFLSHVKWSFLMTIASKQKRQYQSQYQYQYQTIWVFN